MPVKHAAIGLLLLLCPILFFEFHGVVPTSADGAQAALAAPNRAGVAMGHYHFSVRDVAANARFWTTLGGTASKNGTMTIVKLTDVIIVLTEGQPSGVSDGYVVNHVAFREPALATL